VRAIRRALRRLGERSWLLEVAAGVALALAFVDVVTAVAATLTTLTQEAREGSGFDLGFLTFRIAGRPIYVAPVLTSVLAFLVVLATVAAVARRLPPTEEPLQAEDA